MTLISLVLITITALSLSTNVTLISNNHLPDTTEATDTLIIENRTIGSGSKIYTDQDALMVIAPQSHRLTSVAIYYANVSTLQSDSSRLFIKTQRSWSCAPLGNANPLQSDQYTLGITKNIKVDTGWNKYSFHTPIDISADTIYIWPDLIQQIQPRIVYAAGNNPNIRNLTNFLCANPTNGTSSLDYACALTFVRDLPCAPSLTISDAILDCYAADTIIARAMIETMRSVTFRSKECVTLDTSFMIARSSAMIIDMSGCVE